jgi:amino acid transporter
MFSAISTSCAASRATWAFARDKAIPFHAHFAKINPTSDVPDNALLLSTAIQMLLGTIYLGSSTAFNAFVGVAVICLGISNAMPVAVSLLNGRSDITDAPFRLGRLGWVVNVIAVLWITFSVVLFSMPATIPTTQATMSASYVFFSR